MVCSGYPGFCIRNESSIAEHERMRPRASGEHRNPVFIWPGFPFSRKWRGGTREWRRENERWHERDERDDAGKKSRDSLPRFDFLKKPTPKGGFWCPNYTRRVIFLYSSLGLRWCGRGRIIIGTAFLLALHTVCNIAWSWGRSTTNITAIIERGLTLSNKWHCWTYSIACLLQCCCQSFSPRWLWIESSNVCSACAK